MKTQNIPFNKSDLMQIRNMSYSDAKKIIEKLPLNKLFWLFANFCSKNQIDQIFKEYYDYASDELLAKNLGEPKEVMQKYKDKIFGLCKALEKARKSFWIPRYIYTEIHK